MDATLAIPSVAIVAISLHSLRHVADSVQEDLTAFHQQHFNKAVDKEELTRAFEKAQAGFKTMYNTNEDPDDDGLGYYEDGVKRTLSDEQVAMFRHSEIQRLLAERRLRMEDRSSTLDGDHDEKTSSPILLDINNNTKTSTKARPKQESKETIEDKSIRHPGTYDHSNGAEDFEKKKYSHDAPHDHQRNLELAGQGPVTAVAQPDQIERPLVGYDDI